MRQLILKWYFVPKIVATYCGKKGGIEICFEFTRTIIQTVKCGKKSEEILEQNTFLACNWRFQSIQSIGTIKMQGEPQCWNK